MSEVAFGNDGDFSEKVLSHLFMSYDTTTILSWNYYLKDIDFLLDSQQLVLRTNGNLANGMGNLVQRTLRWISFYLLYYFW